MKILVGFIITILVVQHLFAQPNLTVTNRTYQAGESESLFATQQIETSGQVTVQSGADVNYQAATTIRLSPGFTVSSGGRFRAFVPPGASTQLPPSGSGPSAMLALNSSFDSQTVPQFLEPNATAQVVIKMKNTGTASWLNNTVKLASLANSPAALWNVSSVSLSASPLATGGIATFTFTISAPSTEGLYSFKWRMTQEGGPWFGTESPECRIVVVTNPNQIRDGISNADRVRLGFSTSGSPSLDTSNTQLELNIHTPAP